MSMLTFCKFDISIDVMFWQRLRDLKINVWRLREPTVPLKIDMTINFPLHSSSHMSELETKRREEEGCKKEEHREHAKESVEMSLPLWHISAEGVTPTQDVIHNTTYENNNDRSYNKEINRYTNSFMEQEFVQHNAAVNDQFSNRLADYENTKHYINAEISGALTNYNVKENLHLALTKSTLLHILIEEVLAPLFFTHDQRNKHVTSSTLTSSSSSSFAPLTDKRNIISEVSDAKSKNINESSMYSEKDNDNSHNHLVTHAESLTISDSVHDKKIVSYQRNWSSVCFSPFTMHTYADIKHCCFYHCEAFPVLLTSSPWHIDEIYTFPIESSTSRAQDAGTSVALAPWEDVNVMEAPVMKQMTRSVQHAICKHMLELLEQFPERVCNPFWCNVSLDGNVSFREFSPVVYAEFNATECISLQEEKEEEELLLLCFYDFSHFEQSICWPMRNVLTCLRLALPTMQHINLFAVRSSHTNHNTNDISKSSRSDITSNANVHNNKLMCVLLQCSCERLSEELVHDTLCRLENQFVQAHETKQVDTVKENQAMEQEEYYLPCNSVIQVTGWRHKSISKVDLSLMLDPIQRAETETRMNLELMQWRVLPSLELTALSQCRVFILGTGTLGCNVARNLVMWGIRHITLLDRGNVAFSNLARQSLFTFNDALRGRSKVEAAAEALRNILPSIHVQVIHSSICMPGHRLQDTHVLQNKKKKTTRQREEEQQQEEEQWEEHCEEEQKSVDELAVGELMQLIKLMKCHDVTFLLTDSREARWVPSVIAASESIPIINVALGFDSFVVMRHGIRNTSHIINTTNTTNTNSITEQKQARNDTEDADAKKLQQHEPELGCYFCADVVAPRDSVSMRSLDQQCTVTRPGVSTIASAIAVELLASIYQHPERFNCPAYRNKNATTTTTIISNNNNSNNNNGNNSCKDGSNNRIYDHYKYSCGESRLGVIPQQIRGSVYNHSLSHLVGERNPCCTACSDGTVAAYLSNPVEFIMKCVRDPLYIEEVCGIKALKTKWEDEMTDMEWNSDNDVESSMDDCITNDKVSSVSNVDNIVNRNEENEDAENSKES